jgi:hypothetical protein
MQHRHARMIARPRIGRPLAWVHPIGLKKVSRWGVDYQIVFVYIIFPLFDVCDIEYCRELTNSAMPSFVHA